MARARSIKPGFFKNEKLSELPMAARVLFAGLWTIADREGRLEDRPKRIKAEVFPYENTPVEKLLNILDKAGFIKRYTSGSESYISIPTWKKHQNPHVKEPLSTLPAPVLNGPVSDENSSRTGISGTRIADSLFPITDSLNPEPGNPVRPPGGWKDYDEMKFRELLRDDIDGFPDFRKIAESAGMGGSDPDWQMARSGWSTLDFEQRQAAVKGIVDRMTAGATDDPAVKSLPQNYIVGQKWQRPIKSSGNQGGTSAFERAK